MTNSVEALRFEMEHGRFECDLEENMLKAQVRLLILYCTGYVPITPEAVEALRESIGI